MKPLQYLIYLAALFAFSSAHADTRGFFVVTNNTDQNSIIGYQAGATGDYQFHGEFPTGGTGTGDLEIPDLKKTLPTLLQMAMTHSFPPILLQCQMMVISWRS